jgi:hypothetical protein
MGRSMLRPYEGKRYRPSGPFVFTQGSGSKTTIGW